VPTPLEYKSIEMGCILVDFRTTNLFQAPHKTIPDGLHWIGIFHFTKVNLSPVKDLQIDRSTASGVPYFHGRETFSLPLINVAARGGAVC
jgi:hypothetical protein